ncbi:MAG: sulfoxide reductase catalytic subunit YedY [Cellvibrionaceae bacterium]|jgi:sulfoxide reductase catalytic subunit YedY
MLIKTKTGLEIPSSEITSETLYASRRQFIRGAGSIAAGAMLTACRPSRPPETAVKPEAPVGAAPSEQVDVSVAQTVAQTDELGDVLTPYQDIISYNNYYEFTTDKNGVAPLSEGFQTDPWTVEIGGLVNNPSTVDVSDLLKKYDQEERIYRLRCVEAWSMVIPWQGFSLAQLIKEADPTSKAKYVRFETLLDPERMPGQASRWYTWPYVEGLRLDEAMNDLTLMATGVYGNPILPQNGAPLRLVVPWKYGFKSIKSIVKIELVEEQPVSLWTSAAPNEYGFFSNVNPEVHHPRWSQASERRIGEFARRETLPFNGYAEQVASLYDGMDLRVDF